MGYVDTVLDQDEQVLYRAKLHWMIFSGPIALTVLGMSLLVFGSGQVGTFMVVAGSMVVAGLVGLSVKFMRRNATEIAVTSKRVIVKYGVLSLATMEMNTRKIESVSVNQDWNGRTYDYGTVIIRGTGAGIEPIVNVAEPLVLRHAISKAIASA